MPGLSLRGVTRRYGSDTAVNNVSLDVADHELLVLLGPSGSGKSTLLKMIAGIDDVDSGEIWLGERRIDRLPARDRDVAMVFQSYALYPHMSVFENLAFPLRSTGVRRSEVRQRVDDVAEVLELSKLLRRRPHQLSGGQQQRVALGRAIVRRPALFLMDEPLSNLDAKLRMRTRLELVRLHERLGVTTVYVTHDQVEAMTMGHRIAIIDHGVLHQVDAPDRVYDRPADLFVADFIGSPPLNLMPVDATLADGAITFSAEKFELHFPGTVAAGLQLGHAPTAVVLGVRPEQMVIGADLPRGQLVTARVERVEMLGHERLVYVQCGSFVWCVRAPASEPARPGDRVTVGFQGEGVRLFDPASGRSLTDTTVCLPPRD